MRQKTFTILFLMRKGRTKKNGLASIYARITMGSLRQKFYFHCEGRPKLWNQKKERMMGTIRIAMKINEMLDEFRVKIIDRHLNFSIRSAESQRSPRCRRARFVRRCGRIPINSQKYGAFRF